jgi:monomeric isocitrate dehydrogenase
MRPLLLAILLAAAAAVFSSCGGGSSPESVSQFRQEANQVCKDSQQQFDRIQRVQPRTGHEAEQQASALVDVSQQALDNLRQISSPDELKSIWNRYLSAREKDIHFIEAGREAAANSDINAYARATRQAAAQAAYRRQLALQLGLHLCSRPPASLGK